MPNSRAWRIVAMDSASSCSPHPKAHPPPPMAHEPKPTVVIWNPLEPSGRVGKPMMAPPKRGCMKERWHALLVNQCNLDCDHVPVFEGSDDGSICRLRSPGSVDTLSPRTT